MHAQWRVLQHCMRIACANAVNTATNRIFQTWGFSIEYELFVEIPTTVHG